MEEKELEEFLKLTYIHWNSNLPSTAPVKKQIMSTWASALQGISFALANKAILELALVETFMPRPMQVRKRALIISGKINPAPEPATAWAIVQNLGRSVSSGSVEPTQVHECILTAIGKMGGLSVIAFSTNGDRAAFIDVYKNVLNEGESQVFTPTD